MPLAAGRTHHPVRRPHIGIRIFPMAQECDPVLQAPLPGQGLQLPALRSFSQNPEMEGESRLHQMTARFRQAVEPLLRDKASGSAEKHLPLRTLRHEFRGFFPDGLRIDRIVKNPGIAQGTGQGHYGFPNVTGNGNHRIKLPVGPFFLFRIPVGRQRPVIGGKVDMHPCQLTAVRIGRAAGNSGGVTFNEGRLHIIGSADKHAVKDRRRAMPVYQQLQLVSRLDFQARPKPVPFPQGIKQKTEGNVPGITGRHVLLFQAIDGNIPAAPFPAVQQGLQDFFRAAARQAVDEKHDSFFHLSAPSSRRSTSRTAPA